MLILFNIDQLTDFCHSHVSCGRGWGTERAPGNPRRNGGWYCTATQVSTLSNFVVVIIFGRSENFACAETMPNTGPNFLGHMSNTL